MREFLIFLLDWSLRSAFLFLAAMTLSLAMRNAPGAARHFILRCGLAASLLLPVGMLLTYDFPAPLPAPKVISVAPLVPAEQAYFNRTEDLPAPNTSERPSGGYALTLTVVGLLYGLGILACLTRWLLSFAQIQRISQSAFPHPEHVDAVVAREPALTVPVTFGLFNPVILLPSICVEWPAERLEAALFHEIAHVHRRDWLWQSLAYLFTSIQWFNPAAWMLAAALKSTAEESADDFVLESGVSPTMYAKQLLQFATEVRTNFRSSTAMARSGHIVGRVKHILQPRPGVPIRPMALGAIGLAFGLTGVALANYPATGVIRLAMASALNRDGYATWSDGSEIKITSLDDPHGDLDAWNVDGSLATYADNSAPASGNSSAQGGGHADSGHGGSGSGSGSNKSSGGTGGGNGSGSAGGGAGGGAGAGFGAGGFGTGTKGRDVGIHYLFAPRSDDSGLDTQAHIYTRLAGTSPHGGGGGSSSSDGAIGKYEVFEVPKDMKTATFEVGKGVGPFKTEAENTDGAGALKILTSVSYTHGFESSSVNGVNQSHTTSTPHTLIQFPLPTTDENRDWKIEVFDANGKSLKVSMTDFPAVFYKKDPSGRTLRTVQIDADPNTIHRVVLESRDLEWIKIPNVALRPAGDHA